MAATAHALPDLRLIGSLHPVPVRASLGEAHGPAPGHGNARAQMLTSGRSHVAPRGRGLCSLRPLAPGLQVLWGVSGQRGPPPSPQDLSHCPQHGCTTASLRSSCRTGSVPPTVTRGVWQEAGQRAPPLPVRVSHESRPPRRLRTGGQRELTTARNPPPPCS